MISPLTRSNTQKAVLTGLAVFLFIMTMTHFIVYQRYLIIEEAKENEMLREVNLVKDRFKSTLNNSFSATKTLAFLVEEYGIPGDFELLAGDILETNKHIDVIELTQGGVITHVYPLKGNESVIGYNILKDSARNREAFTAIEKKELFFAGPLELKQGGTAIIGRLPIFKNDTFWGFSAAIVRLSTLLKAVGIDTFQNSKYVYQLSKINPTTGKEEFFLPRQDEAKTGTIKKATVLMSDGEWNLSIMTKDTNLLVNLVVLYFFGVLLSVTAGGFTWHLARQPAKLNKLVEEKTLQLAASEKYFRSLIEKSADGIVLMDVEGKVLYQSHSAERISSYSVQEMQELNGLSLIHPDDRQEDARVFAELAGSPGKQLSRSHRFRHRDGHYMWLEGTYSNLLNDENVNAIVYNYYDATERIEAEQKAMMAQRLYQFISKINQTMMHVNNEHDLFREVCTIAVELGKFRMAWVGMADENRQSIVPVMHAGEESGYLSQIGYISLETRGHKGPTSTAMLTGNHVVCNDIKSDAIMRPWADAALARGYHSLIALPIRKFGEVLGAFNLYATTRHFFDQKEIDLLTETSENISFTLENFEKEKIRKLAEVQIRAEKTLSESIINSVPGVLYMYDREGKFLHWNTNMESVSGYNSEEIKIMHPTDFISPDERMLLQQKIDEVFREGEAEMQASFYTRNRQRIPYFFNGRKVNFTGTDYLIGMGIDISDRVAAENELFEHSMEIKRLTSHMGHVQEEERTRIAREIHDELGQQLTALKLNTHWIKKRVATAETAIREKVSDMLTLIDDTIKTVRRIASELRPGILDDLGLMSAIEWQGEEFEKQSGVKLTFTTNMNDFNPERHMATNIFRVYQEALTNIARHANATMVETSLEQTEGYIVLKVNDNGRGFIMENVDLKSLGLIGMKERALSFNGELSIESEQGKGTRITLKVPMNNI